MKFTSLLIAAASAASSSKLIGTKQDCCRYNGASVGVGRKYNGDFAKCEAGCKATKNCNFLSYNKSWKACVLCSKCDLSSKSHGRHYNSRELIKAAAQAPSLRLIRSEIKLELEVQPDYNEKDLVESIARELGVSAGGSRRRFHHYQRPSLD